jgi:hypothetical protein
VKIDNIEKFSTPQGLGDKVVSVEKSKDGVYAAVLLSSGRAADSMSEQYPAYQIEYKIESSHGNNHYLVKASVIDMRLYVFTIQCSEKDFADAERDMRSIISTVHVKSGDSAV